MFLLLYKRPCSGSPVCADVGPQRVERGCALLICPQPGRTIQVSAKAAHTCWRSTSAGARGIALGSSCAQQISLEADK